MEPAYAPDEGPEQHRAGSFEFPPVFNSAERKRNFDFPVAIQQIAAELRTPTNQLCFSSVVATSKRSIDSIQSRGSAHATSATWLNGQVLGIETVRLAEYDKQTMARHQALILDFYGFRPFKPHGQAILVEEIARLVGVWSDK